ncbi:AraC family transcriptional regulator [Cupriavidus basilensis OR16]|uniref:AraC family transcriptional regulator n=1 Tax=Cupriavidus basilensis OR16 TaxID=1127483 RepID=H1SC12_9BURK|nr:AraC family transcriptional regulator [Cupriavidus basilensis OR16]
MALLARSGAHYSLFVDRRTLGLEEPCRNKKIKEALAEHVASISVDRELCFADQVSAVIQHLLPTGYCTLAAVSSCLSMHPRGLQRALALHGSRFADLLAETRREMALRYMADGIPLSIQASLLGYRENASLYRALGGWRGVSRDSGAQYDHVTTVVEDFHADCHQMTLSIERPLAETVGRSALN